MTPKDTLRFDRATYEEACGLVESAPLSLTECHFDQLAIVSPRLEVQAREAVRHAQLALVAARSVPTTPPVQTKSIAPAPTPDAGTWENYVKRNGHVKVTVKMLAAVWDVVTSSQHAMNAKNVALEQRNQALEERVLQLEAADAARTMPRVER